MCVVFLHDEYMAFAVSCILFKSVVVHRLSMHLLQDSFSFEPLCRQIGLYMYSTTADLSSDIATVLVTGTGALNWSSSSLSVCAEDNIFG